MFLLCARLASARHHAFGQPACLRLPVHKAGCTLPCTPRIGHYVPQVESLLAHALVIPIVLLDRTKQRPRHQLRKVGRRTEFAWLSHAVKCCRPSPAFERSLVGQREEDLSERTLILRRIVSRTEGIGSAGGRGAGW
eukprot:scaffold73355_cov28-Tisochrysis_lutea.AAC.2